MKKRVVLTVFFISILISGFCFLTWPALAQSTGSKKVNDINDLNTVTFTLEQVSGDSFYSSVPPATVECIFGGNLAEVFHGKNKFKSSENAILVDAINRKLGVREKIVTAEDEKKAKGEVDMYIEVQDVSNEDLINLLVLRKTVRTKHAKIDLVLRKTTPDGQTILKTNFKDEGENPNPAILFSRVTNISSTKFKDETYYLVDGVMKLRLTEELKGKDSNNDETLLDDRTGVMKCVFKGCAVVKTDLQKIKQVLGSNLGEGNILGRE